MSIDPPDPPPAESLESSKLSKKHKKEKGEENVYKLKKSKKQKSNESNDTLEASAEDGLPSGKEKKKKKKKIVADSEETNPNAPAVIEERSHKKRKQDALFADDADLSAKNKKIKKKRKRENNVKSADEADSVVTGPSERNSSGSKRPANASELDGKASKKKKKRKEAESDAVALEPQTIPEAGSSKLTTKSRPSDKDISDYLKTHSIMMDFGTGDASIPSNLRPFLSFTDIVPYVPTPLQDAFASFKEPSPIQACTWPAILEGRDVVGIAETGSGKTLAFGIPAVSKLVKSQTLSTSEDGSSTKASKKKKAKHGQKAQIAVLVLAPTRELAIQTHETLSTLGAPFGLKSVAVYGGVDKAIQRRALQEADTAMIVGTPGRIIDLMEEGVCDLSGVSYVVLDEADRMLDKGFENDIRAILGQTGPAESRQTLMFSATWPDAVRKLAATFQRNPARVTVGSDDLTANRRVEQVVEVFDDQREKDSRLTAHLRRLKARKGNVQATDDEYRILIFVLYKKEAARVEQTLRRAGFSVGVIHGDLAQAAREAALDAFRAGRTQLLVATDVAARGLDIPNVGLVMNYSFPLTVEDYIHRIGRTGRGGRSGKSITFFTGDNHERALAGELAKVLRESGFDTEPLKKFPMTIKKKTHSVYGAFYRDDIPTAAVPTRLKF